MLNCDKLWWVSINFYEVFTKWPLEIGKMFKFTRILTKFWRSSWIPMPFWIFQDANTQSGRDYLFPTERYRLYIFLKVFFKLHLRLNNMLSSFNKRNNVMFLLYYYLVSGSLKISPAAHSIQFKNRNPNTDSFLLFHLREAIFYLGIKHKLIFNHTCDCKPINVSFSPKLSISCFLKACIDTSVRTLTGH